MIVLAGGDIVLPDRILTNASLVIDQGRIAGIGATRTFPSGASVIDVRDGYVVPGFVDVHVHGIEGRDTLDPGDAIAEIASRLPRYGVTAFCPTTVACASPRPRSGAAPDRGGPCGSAPRQRARPARTPRKQLHQPRLRRRAAQRLPPSAE